MVEVHKLYDNTVTLEFDQSKHRYEVIVDGKRVSVPGATSITGVVDDGKSDRLMGWAVKLAAEYVRAALVPGVPLDELQIAQLVDNAKRAHRQKKQDAADIGKITHEWLERYIGVKIAGKGKSPKPLMNEQARNGVDAYLSWENQHKVEYIFSERRCFSLQHWFAGTLDILALVDDVLTVVDLKTGSGVYQEHFLQTAAYARMLEEEHPDETIGARVIVRTDKQTGLASPHPVDDPYHKGQCEICRQSPGIEGDFKAFLGAREVYRRMKGL